MGNIFGLSAPVILVVPGLDALLQLWQHRVRVEREDLFSLVEQRRNCVGRYHKVLLHFAQHSHVEQKHLQKTRKDEIELD